MQRREAKNRPKKLLMPAETERPKQYRRISPQKRPIWSFPGNPWFGRTGWWRSSGPNWLLPTQSSNRSPKLESGTEFCCRDRAANWPHSARLQERRALIADAEAAEDDMSIFLGPPKPMNGSPK